ncbi:MAG: Fe-S cluster assembly protein SufD [Bacteroidales bacterium]|nr:Fe-S cluster assembly protein SufD [Bacteroidales bacterium]
MSTTTEIEKKYIDFYIDHKAILDQQSSDIVNKHRTQAIENFKFLGLPTSNDERYKYTNLSKVFDQNFDMRVGEQIVDLNVESIFKCDVIRLDAYLALLAKGQYVTKERVVSHDESIIVCSLKEAAKKYSQLFEKYYNQLAPQREDGVIELNTALAFDGVFIYVPKGKVVDKPIQIVNLQVDGKENNAIQLRHLIVLEDRAEAKLIFCDDSLTSNEHLSSAVAEVFVGENAHLEMSKMQNEHNESRNISNTIVRQSAHSVVTSNTVSLLGGVIRNNLHIEMDGEYCEANAYGIALIDKAQKVDTFTYIHHAHPNCNSNQLYKNIIDDEAVGVFSGTVLVDKNAQKTNAFQANNNIILTDKAKMNTKPQLVIYADDVKCSHGATVGQLDENAMFYMRARGIEEKDAKMLLMYAFADDVIRKMSITSLRENTEDLVRRRLSGELSLCRNCSSRILMNSTL